MKSTSNKFYQYLLFSKLPYRLISMMSNSLRSALGNTTEKIPEIEHRLDDLTHKVARTEAEVHSIQKQPNDKVQ